MHRHMESSGFSVLIINIALDSPSYQSCTIALLMCSLWDVCYMEYKSILILTEACSTIVDMILLNLDH